MLTLPKNTREKYRATLPRCIGTIYITNTGVLCFVSMNRLCFATALFSDFNKGNTTENGDDDDDDDFYARGS